MPDNETVHEILIIGAGPAGLTAAWEAEKHGVKTLILESDKEVGGISRTVEENGWRFDIGGHRFFTKVEEVYEIWDEILDKEDWLEFSKIVTELEVFTRSSSPYNKLLNAPIKLDYNDQQILNEYFKI